jgi:hypothetical protein
MYTVDQAVISVLAPILRMVKFDDENEEVMIISSPIRLIVGDSARLVRLAMSHHIAINGSIVCIARQNKMDEVRPWATINAVASIELHGD